MSKAFTREDVDPPERSGRRRSPSGLPPGAINYITPHGDGRLRAELTKLRAAGNDPERVAELEGILESVQIVDLPDLPANSVGFGATVTVEWPDGKVGAYKIVGVDECGLFPNAVSWISPLGKALLSAELGGRVMLEPGRTARVTRIEYSAN